MVSLCQLSSLLVLLTISVVSGQDKCELHCTRNETASTAECHSHHPFGGCSHVLDWRGDSKPMYKNFSIDVLSVYLGDFITFDQSSSTEADTIVAVQTFDGFQTCALEESISVIDSNAITGTFKYDATNFYYYASQQGCVDDSKLVVGVYTVEGSLTCHDHAYGGAPEGETCHCHNREEIACKKTEAVDDTIYEEKIAALESFCMGVIQGIRTRCPSRCARPMELLHVHYSECPSREKDQTFLRVAATGLCHPVELNYGDRECPAVDVPTFTTSVGSNPETEPVTEPEPEPETGPAPGPAAGSAGSSTGTAPGSAPEPASEPVMEPATEPTAELSPPIDVASTPVETARSPIEETGPRSYAMQNGLSAVAVAAIAGLVCIM